MIPASLLTGIRKILHEFCRGDAEGLEAILDGAIADSDCQMGFPRHTMAKKIDSINLLTWMVVCDRGCAVNCLKTQDIRLLARS